MGSAHDAFPAEVGEFEVYKQSEPKICDSQVADHLRDVCGGEIFHHLRIHNDEIVDPKSGTRVSTTMPS